MAKKPKASKPTKVILKDERAFALRLPEELYERVGHRAAETRRSINSLILDALHAYLDGNPNAIPVPKMVEELASRVEMLERFMNSAQAKQA